MTPKIPVDIQEDMNPDLDDDYYIEDPRLDAEDWVQADTNTYAHGRALSLRYAPHSAPGEDFLSGPLHR